MSSPYETQSHKLARKFREAPFVPLGIAGLVGALGYGIYGYKHRQGMSTSVYLMHLRVRAQGMVVGALTVGVAYTLLREYIFTTHGIEKREKEE